MFRKSIAYVLISALFASLFVAPSALAKTKEDKALEHAAKVRTEIAKLGTGTDARIAVKLRDKSKVAGYVSQVGEEAFVITDLKNGATTTVPYPNVTQVKGNNLSTKAKIAIGAGVAVGVIMLIFLLTDPFHQS